MYAAATGRLDDADDLHHRPESAVVVVLAAEGYPAAPVPGGTIEGLDAAAEVPGAWVLHAGTRRGRGRPDRRRNAGQVLDVMAVGADLASARDTAYRAVSCLELAGGHHRSDIALAAARGEITSQGDT